MLIFWQNGYFALVCGNFHHQPWRSLPLLCSEFNAIMTKHRWGKQQQNYLITQFRSNALDPTKTGRDDRDDVVAAVSAEEHSILHPFLGEPKGTRRDNTQFLGHYRKAAGEYFVLRGLEGIRRKG